MVQIGLMETLHVNKNMKNILIVNPGSTGNKYTIFNNNGDKISHYYFKNNESKKELSFLDSQKNISKIGIRVVHGGETNKPVKIDRNVKKIIEKYSIFAPIHNTKALLSIKILEKVFKRVPIFACFDTEFHTTIPNYLNQYMIKKDLVEKYNIKKYGFHGLALESVIEKISKQKSVPKNLISIHLGGGASITGIKNKKSFVTTMELTPLSGIPMTTRSGNIDPGIFYVLEKAHKMKIDKITNILNNESGFLGMCKTKDTKKIMDLAEKGHKNEKLAFDIFVSEIVQKIYGFYGLMGKLDAISFSGGIGFGNSYLRKSILNKIKNLNIKKENIFIIDTDEESVIFSKIKKLK
jgi:acetate kinase